MVLTGSGSYIMNKKEEDSIASASNNSLTQEKNRQNITSLRESVIANASESFQQVKDLSNRVNGGITLNPQQYQLITSQLATSENPQQDENKFAQALVYSKNLGISLTGALNNLDGLNYAQLGRKVQSSVTDTQAVINSFTVGSLSLDRASIAQQWRQARDAGLEDRANELDQQIQALDAQIQSLQDNTPRGLGTTLLKLGAGTLPYTGQVLMKSLAIGAGVALTATGVGAMAGVPLATAGLLGGIGSAYSAAAIFGAATTAGAFKATYDIESANTYYDFIKGGVDEDVATWASSASGLVNAAIESFLGTIPTIARSITGKGVSALTTKVMSRLALNGAWGALATGGMEYLASSAEEGLEEVLQAFTDRATEAIAYELSDKIAPEHSQSAIKEALEAGVAGFASSLVLGLPSSAINAKTTVQDSKRLNQEAQAIPSKEAYIKRNIDSIALGELTEAEKKQTLGDLWEKQQSKASQATTETSKAELKTVDTDTVDQAENVGELDDEGNLIEGNPSNQPTKPIQRMADGRLYTYEDAETTARTNTDGSESHVLTLGSVGTTRRYGSVYYTIKDNEITIDSVQTKLGYEDITADGVIELSRRYEGYNITWDPETEAQIKIKNELAVNNPRGADFGLNYYDQITDTDAAIKLAKGVKNVFPNMTKDEATVASQIFQLVAKSENKSINQWMNDNFIGFEKKDLGQGKKGAISTVQTEKGVKAIVYASENADFSTFAHEVFHVVRRTTDQSQNLASAMQEASKSEEFKQYVKEHQEIIHMSPDEAVEAVQSFGDTWTVAQEELAATLFESYLRDGATSSSKLKNLFKKIADWFARIYRTIRNTTVKMDDRIVKVFDSILDGDTDVSKQFNDIGKESNALTTVNTENITSNAESVGELDINDDDILYQIAPEDYKPQKTGIAYKAMWDKGDGNYYPVMIENANGEPFYINKWLIADIAPQQGTSKTGRPQVSSGGKNAKAGKGKLSMRPGFHAGLVPYATQWNMVDPGTGEKSLFPADIVWAEIEYSADVDYQEEADNNGMTPNGKFRHSYAGIPDHIPTDGFYRYRTNPDPNTPEWIITGAMKLNRVLSNEEADQMALNAGYPQVKRSTKGIHEILSSKNKATESNTLFQTSDPEQEILNEAKSFEDEKEWIAYANAMLDIDTYTASKAFNTAHGISEDFSDMGKTSIIDPNLSDQEKDDKFVQIIETDKGLDDFVTNIRALSYHKYEMERGLTRGGIDETDVTDFDIANRFETEASPFIVAIAKGTNELTDKSKKTIRSMLANNARMYRDLYSAILHDESLAAVQYDEFLPPIEQPNVSTISIMDRKRLSDKIEAEGLKKKILSGEETLEGEVEKVIKQLDIDIANLEEDVKNSEAEVEKIKAQMSEEERRRLHVERERREAKQSLDRANRFIRSKLDAGRKISAKEITNRLYLQEKIELLEKQIAELDSQNKDKAKAQRVNATEKKNEAIANLKSVIRQKEQERREAKKVREYKQRLASVITEKPSNAIDYHYAQKINAIRSLVDPNYRSETIRFGTKKYTITEFRELVEKEGLLIEDLTDYQIVRLTKKSLDTWTISELEEMAETVSHLRSEGRQIWQAKVDKRNYEAQVLQNAIIREVLNNTNYKAPDDLTASIDSQKRRRSLQAKWKTFIGKTINMDRKAQMIDNGTKGVAYELLVRKKRNAQELEYQNVAKRQQPISALMKSLGVSVSDLYQTVKLTIDGKPYEFSYSDLIYGINAQKEERNYRAFAYGDLVSTQDKIDLNHDNKLIEKLGDHRNSQFLNQAEMYLEGKDNLKQVFEAIEADLQAQAPRINDISIRAYNQGLDIQDYYMPIYRKDFNGTEIAQQLQDDIFNKNAGKSATTPKHGSFKQRIDISADHQMPTSLDYFGTWAKSLTQQEHIISSLEYTRELNRVFKNLGSKDLRANITSTFGEGMMADIDEYINEVANPSVFTDVQGLNSGLRLIRGGLYTGYLGYKMSSIVLQGITSPMPFLSEVNPIQLISGLFKMTAQPVKTWNFICDQSQFMANRSMHPVIDEIKHRAETNTDSKVKRAYNQFLEFGTSGLEMIDRWAVGAGWIACYEKKLATLENQNSEKSMKEAARYADEVVYTTQPLGDLTELSPLFKSQSEFARAFTQFQTALNVIWNNITYDVPTQLKNHQYRRAVGTIAGYSIAGILLTAVMDGFSESDDDTEKLKQLIFGATTQFTDSFPLIGGTVEDLAKTLITGERPYQYPSSFLPSFDKISSGVMSLSQGDIDKALNKIAEGIALALGLPVSGIKEAIALYNDGDISPEALLGQRDNN